MGEILIVDDERKITKILGKFLESVGHHCILCNCGKDAIKKIISNADLLIVDMHLGDMLGKEVASIFKETKGIPVIMMTASPIEDVSETAPIDLVLRKPFDLNFLEKVVSQLL